MQELKDKFVKLLMVAQIGSATLGCTKVQRSPIDRELVKGKIEAREIVDNLRIYRADFGCYPVDLGELKRKVYGPNRLELVSFSGWAYASVDSGRGFSLVSASSLDGYFVYIDSSGNVRASNSSPEFKERLYVGP